MRQLLEYRGAVLDLNDASLTYEGKRLELTKNDFRILQTLMEQPGKVISRETMMLRLWETDCFVDDNTLTVSVTRLRKKLEAIGLEDFILTRKGAGYHDSLAFAVGHLVHCLFRITGHADLFHGIADTLPVFGAQPAEPVGVGGASQ